MKILLISNFFPPENFAASFRAYENCRKWSEKNEVSVLTGNPNYPLGKLYKGYKNKLIKIELVEKIRIIRSKVFILPNKNLIFQMLNTLGFFLFGLFNIYFNSKMIGESDIVIGTSGQILTPLLALIYSKNKKVPFVLELRDISFIQMLALGKTENSIAFKILKKLELYLCKKSDLIVVVTEGFKKELISYGIPEYKVKVIPNGVNIYTEEIFTREEEKKEKILISYFGNFGKSQDLISVLKLLEKYKENFEVLLIGDGKEKNRIKEFQNESKLKITLLDSMTQSSLEKYYIDTDLCLISLMNNKLFKNTIPSKIFQNSKRKKTSLYIGPKSEGSEIIEKGKFGYTLLLDQGEKPEIFFDKMIEEIKMNSRILVEKGENGYKYVNTNYNREKLAEKYEKILHEVINEYN